MTPGNHWESEDLVFYKQQAVALASTSSSRAQQFRRAGSALDVLGWRPWVDDD